MPGSNQDSNGPADYPNGQLYNNNGYLPNNKYRNPGPNQMPQEYQYDYDAPPMNGFANCNKNSERPCLYKAMAGETLEQICHIFMIPLTRLLYYNLKYGKNEPLAAGCRIIIPEYNVVCPNTAAPTHKYYNNK